MPSEWIHLFELFSTRSIGRDLLLGLVPIIIIVTSGVGSINYFINAKRGVRIINEQAEDAAENLARILAHSMYKSNHSETAMIGREYKHVLNVASVSIFDEIHNTLYVHDNDIPGDNITVKKTIVLFGKKLGFVEVAFAMNSIIRQQKEFLYYTLVIAVFIIIAVGIASIVLLEILLRKPFSALIDGVSSIAAGSYEQRLAPLKHHYMNLIAQSVNTMAKKIAGREQHLKILVNKLEKQVVEREEAEATLRVIKEQFEEMTNLLPETVFETDERGYFIFLNRSGFEQFGWNSEDVENGLKFIDLFTAQDRQRIEKNLKSALIGEVVRSSEYLAKNKNGMTFQVFVHFNSIIHDRRINGIRGIAVDITESKRIEKELLLYQENLRSLTNKLLVAEERERHRIASEIHDRIGHVLANVAIKIGMLRDNNMSHEKNIILKEIEKLIEQSAQDVQSLIFEISPPILYDIGLVAAVDWLIEKTSKTHGLKIVLKHDDELKPISKKFRALIFRAVRELLFNVIKHANANYIEVSINRQERHLVISVQDDGVGISTSSTGAPSGAEGFGLFSIRERVSHLNGSLTVHSKPHQGTRVVIKIPDS